MQRRRGHAKLPKTPLVIGAIAAAIAIGGAVSRTVTASGLLEAPPEPMVVRQPANGLTEADITPEYAAEIRDYLVEGTRANLPADAGLVSGRSATVMAVGEKRIGVVRIDAGEGQIISIFGLRDKDVVRGTCVSLDGEADYRAPSCATAVQKSLGVELP
jgi:hypothetical protein